MKIDKNQQKQLVNEIRISSKQKGYKVKANRIYKVKDNMFIHCSFLIVSSQKIVYRIYIKHYAYDDIFWKIMQMPDNIQEPDSLRACGAFRAPSVLLNNGEIEVTDKFEELARYIVEQVDKYSHDFTERYNIDEYVINNITDKGEEIMQCLAYIHIEKKAEALKIAKDSVNKSESGGYENEGKTFFEWVLFLAESI